MATPSRRSSLAEKERALLWGAWVELGVSGWQRTHAEWAVDPEPLIIATAALRDADPRLRDEALDWCIRYWRYVSRVRLRNLLREQHDEVCEAWGPFAATVSHHAGVAWPNATSEFSYKTTGRSALDSMDQASRAWLRLRGMFGLGARTETLRFFLSGHRRATVARIAEHVRYAKRVVADECDTLAKAGVLRSEQVANRFYYMLNRAEALREFVGPIAPIRPDWSALFRVTSSLVALEQSSKTLSTRALMVEAHRVAQMLEADLNALDIEDRPRLIEPDNYWPALREFAERHMGAWATGPWSPEEGAVEMKSPRLMRRASASGSR
jgi:hypothetical protein